MCNLKKIMPMICMEEAFLYKKSSGVPAPDDFFI